MTRTIFAVITAMVLMGADSSGCGRPCMDEWTFTYQTMNAFIRQPQVGDHTNSGTFTVVEHSQQYPLQGLAKMETSPDTILKPGYPIFWRDGQATIVSAFKTATCE